MKMSTKGRYALRVMIDLATQPKGLFVPMKEIADRQGVSRKYVEKLLPELIKNNLIETAHGKGGGYRLTKSTGDYTVGEILRLTEGDLAPVVCMGEDAQLCGKTGCCKTQEMWYQLNTVINNYLDSVKLSDLI